MEKIFSCELCNKKYKSKSSLCNHNKKFHSENTHTKPHFCVEFPHKTTQNHTKSEYTINLYENINLEDEFQCYYCSKIFSRKDSLYRHIDKNYCKVKKKLDKNTKLEEENELLKSKIEDMEKKISNIEKSLDNTDINNGSINNTTMNNNSTSNNYQQTNNVMIQLGKENVINVLPKSEQIKILNTCYNSLYRLVKEIHCNDDYPQFKNVAITNLTDGYAHKYDDKKQGFIKCHKNDVIEYLIENRILDIEDLLNANIDDINEEKVKKLHILIEEINDKRGCYKDKKEQIKLLLYNECKKNIIKN